MKSHVNQILARQSKSIPKTAVAVQVFVYGKGKDITRVPDPIIKIDIWVIEAACQFSFGNVTNFTTRYSRCTIDSQAKKIFSNGEELCINNINAVFAQIDEEVGSLADAD